MNISYNKCDLICRHGRILRSGTSTGKCVYDIRYMQHNQSGEEELEVPMLKWVRNYHYTDGDHFLVSQNATLRMSSNPQPFGIY